MVGFKPPHGRVPTGPPFNLDRFCHDGPLARTVQDAAVTLDAFVSAATLAVAALPEEFPLVFTVFLGVGVHRLARRRALVRRAVSVENVGRVTTICSDKTGTITQGRLALTQALPVNEDAQLLSCAAMASRRDNGDPMDRTVFSSASRKAFSGLALAIVRGNPGQPGEITVTATSAGLGSGEVRLIAR